MLLRTPPERTQTQTRNMAFKYLTQDVIDGFDKYKYSAVDTSPVSKYITHPFWNWIVEFYPKWIAPNVLTLGGFLLYVVQFCMLTYLDNDFYASDGSQPAYPGLSRLVWLISAGCMFWAHTLDGTDGKQARRTKTSGPLGELFDHGLDSWATHFMPVCMYSAFGRGEYGLSVYRMLGMIICVWGAFMITHWEKYNTGTLYLPWGYDISQLGMALMYFVAFLADDTFFDFTFPVLNLTFAEVAEICMHFSVWGVSMPVSIWNVYISYRDKTGKNYSFYEAMRPLVPFIIHFALTFAWIHYTSYDILRRHPRLFYFAVGSVFSNYSCRLIVNGMSNTRCEIFNWLLVPLIAIVGGVCTLRLGITEYYLLWAFTIFGTAATIHYGICVVQQLAEHFNIYVFSVNKPPKRD